ncbi:MAG TPA: hypothetical protein VMV92_29355 [Streptosporangiaceae bacterium]|nr:hypothetical protein [Streptosporangiaceae bacterium]
MPARRRHPKKDIEAALRAAEAAGWVVVVVVVVVVEEEEEEEEVHHGHRWGVIRCPSGEHVVAVWSTPRDPATLGKRIREQVARCPHQEGVTS